MRLAMRLLLASFMADEKQSVLITVRIFRRFLLGLFKFTAVHDPTLEGRVMMVLLVSGLSGMQLHIVSGNAPCHLVSHRLCWIPIVWPPMRCVVSLAVAS